MSPWIGLLSWIPPHITGILEVGEKGSLLQDPWHDSSYFAPDRKEDNEKSHLCTPCVFAKINDENNSFHILTLVLLLAHISLFSLHFHI